MSFEPLLRVWNDARIVALDDDLLVVDKPPGMAVQGGDARHAGDVVARLSSWLAERGHDDTLGVHQRLDQDASGVVVFTRRRELSRELSRLIEPRSVRRVYVAAVSDPGLPDQGVLEHRLVHDEGAMPRVVTRGGRHTRARFRVIARSGGRALVVIEPEMDGSLVALEPETGGTHPLRAQLSHSSAPIAGDRLYGGALAPRLMLHARSVELAGRRFEAPLPDEIQAWFDGRSLELGPRSRPPPPSPPPPPPLPPSLPLPLLLPRLIDAGVRRALLAETDVFRLVNDIGDLLPGVTVDRYGDFVVLSVAGDEACARREELAGALIELGARGVYLKLRVRADLRRRHAGDLAPAAPIAGEPAPETLVVHEGALAFHVKLADGLSTGLFVDQRDNRARVCELSSALSSSRARDLVPARLLNLFSYTCSFSVAAAASGAHTTSVDLSARALARGRDHFTLNGLDPAVHRFEKADVLDWLRRACRRKERFDLIVLDPPSFGTRGRRATFSVSKSYVALARDALSLLAPGGRLLAITHHTRTSRTALRRVLHDAAREARVELRRLEDLPSGLDCPDWPAGPAPSRSVLATLAPDRTSRETGRSTSAKRRRK